MRKIAIVVLLIGLSAWTAMSVLNRNDEEVVAVSMDADREVNHDKAQQTKLERGVGEERAQRKVVEANAKDVQPDNALTELSKNSDVAQTVELEVRLVGTANSSNETSDAPTREVSFEVLRRGTRDDVLYAGTTNAEGKRVVNLGSEFTKYPHEAEGLPVEVRVVESGAIQRRMMAHPEEGKPNKWYATIKFQAGGTIRGRVLSEVGEGVSARVALNQWIETDTGRQLEGFKNSQRTFDEGWFELPVSASGLRVITASARSNGRGASPELQIDCMDPPQDLEIVVHGSGLLRGVVIDERGGPAAGVTLNAMLAELHKETGEFGWTREAVSRRRAEGLGGYDRMTTTDGDGRFEIAGLIEAEDYVIDVFRYDESPETNTIIASCVKADGMPFQLIWTRPHIVVQLLDEEGNRGKDWSAQIADEFYGNPYLDDQRWPKNPRVFVIESNDYERTLDSESDRLDGRRSEAGEFVFEANHNATYRVGVIGGAFAGDFSTVEIDSYGGRKLVQFLPRPKSDLGQLDVRVAVANDDESLVDGLTLTYYEVSIVDFESGAALFRSIDMIESDLKSFEAPPGVYRVIVNGKEIDDGHGGSLDDRALGRVEAKVELLAGVRTELNLELSVGATLEVNLVGALLPTDIEGVFEKYPEWREPGYLDDAEEWAKLAQLRIVQPGFGSEPVPWKEEVCATGSDCENEHNWWGLNSNGRSKILPAGKFTLIATLSGGREVSTPVELRAGETTSVEISFD